MNLMRTPLKSGAVLTVALACFFSTSTSLHAQFEEDSVAQLVEKVASDDRDTRRDAAYELVARGAKTTEVIRALADRVEDDDEQVRFLALLGLSRAGESAADAIPQLLDCLDSRSDQVRFRAADALGKIGKQSVEPLAEHWDNVSDREKRGVALAVEIIGAEAADAFTDRLKTALRESADDLLHVNSANALVSLRTEDGSLALELSKHANATVRSIAYKQLFASTKDSHELLETALADESETVRELAVVVLSRNSELNDETKLEMLVQSLGDSNVAVRSAAVFAVGQISVDRNILAQTLSEQLSSQNSELANASAKALARLGSSALVALPEMLAGVRSGALDESVVAKPIASIGSAAIPALFAALTEDPESAEIITQCLAAMDESAYPVLVAELDNTDANVRAVALRSLAGASKLGDGALQKIGKLVEDEAADVRAASVAILAGYSANRKLAEAIVAATRDESAVVRGMAVKVLHEVELDSASKSEIYTAGLIDKESAVRVGALQSLKEDGNFLTGHLEKVLDLCTDTTSQEVQLAAIEALQGLEEQHENQEVSVTLERVLRESDSQLRTAATQSANEIGLRTPELLKAIAGNVGEDLDLLRESLVAIAEYGSDASELIPVVTQLIDHETEDIQTTAITTLQDIHNDDELLAQTLTGSLDHDRWAVRTTAARTLGKVGEAAKCAVPELFGWMVREQDDNIASACLKEIDAAPESAVDLFFEHIDSENRRTSYYAIYLLGKVDPPSEELLTRLEEFSEKKGRRWRSDFRGKVLNQAIDNIKEALEAQEKS